MLPQLQKVNRSPGAARQARCGACLAALSPAFLADLPRQQAQENEGCRIRICVYYHRKIDV
ncbi:hypothetical protein BN2497_1033 [Janthinobacterium sp. CG23_2]|nr:hypothetical protein BN2497_1033 [Janthinobacterium sp. CG23_2]CUU26914.1 hypothetical protein BN3177_1033 [Janthinobacterium sp. CG23_2]